MCWYTRNWTQVVHNPVSTVCQLTTGCPISTPCPIPSAQSPCAHNQSAVQCLNISHSPHNFHPSLRYVGKENRTIFDEQGETSSLLLFLTQYCWIFCQIKWYINIQGDKYYLERRKKRFHQKKVYHIQLLVCFGGRQFTFFVFFVLPLIIIEGI